MHFSPKVQRALDNFRRVIDEGRLPHALLVAGHPRTSGLHFVEALLHMLFPPAKNQTDDAARLHQHVDIQWIEPESKSRQIRIDQQIRPLISFMGLSSYEGGWKAGVILFADRMNASAQNALLKTLEEPPANSLLVLVTASPDALLTTIRSRAQMVDVLDDVPDEAAPWYPQVMGLLRNPPRKRASEMVAWVDALTLPLRELEAIAKQDEAAAEESESDRSVKAQKEIIEGRISARVGEMREEFFAAIQRWQADALIIHQGGTPGAHRTAADVDILKHQAAGVSFRDMARRVKIVDEVRELLLHNIKDNVALIRLARALAAGE